MDVDPVQNPEVHHTTLNYSIFLKLYLIHWFGSLNISVLGPAMLFFSMLFFLEPEVTRLTNIFVNASRSVQCTNRAY